MNFVTHINAVTAIVVSADAASLWVSALFFSERVRRWTYRKRWGSHPAPTSHLYSVVLADMDDPCGGSIRLQPNAILRNPFDPRARETIADAIAVHAGQDHFRRLTFRRSTVLQQRIAAYERTLARCAPPSPQPQTQAQPTSSPKTVPLNPSFESFGMGHLQAAQPS